MNRSLNALVVGLSLLACADMRVVNQPYREVPTSDGYSEATRACLANSASQIYLEEMHRRIIEAWAVKFGTEAHEVVARISINESGEIRDVSILKSPTQEFSELATRAIRSAAPFGSIPDEASCLSSNPLRLKFSTFRK